jgi:hypothetical protein
VWKRAVQMSRSGMGIVSNDAVSWPTTVETARFCDGHLGAFSIHGGVVSSSRVWRRGRGVPRGVPYYHSSVRAGTPRVMRVSRQERLCAPERL